MITSPLARTINGTVDGTVLMNDRASGGLDLTQAESDLFGSVVQGLRHPFFAPFLAHFSAPPHPTRFVCRALVGANADRVLIGAWNLML